MKEEEEVPIKKKEKEKCIPLGKEEEKKKGKKKGKEAKYSLLYCVFHLQNKKKYSLLCPFCVKSTDKQKQKQKKQKKGKSGKASSAPAVLPFVPLSRLFGSLSMCLAAWEFLKKS
jgi:hypothetical protein